MIPRHIGSMTKTSNQEGIIFDIQRYSIHDGPGIRTIVFFKGCSLRCSWCSNPESQSNLPEIMWLENSCIHCRKCEDLCPEGAFSETVEGLKHIDRNLCTRCGICDENCYADAMKLVGRYVTVSEVMEEVEKDKSFYNESGGGITLSGGEPLLQPEFASKLLRESKLRGFNTVVETAGYVPWKNFKRVVSDVDLYLYDIKSMDSEIHKRYGGFPNELILDNLKKLSLLGASVLIRVPIIPGVNDSTKNIRLTAEFAKSLNAKGVELLEYHRLGVAKHRRLGKDYAMDEIASPKAEVMNRLKKLAHKVLVS